MTKFPVLAFLIRPRVVIVASTTPVLIFLIYLFNYERMEEALSSSQREEILLENILHAKYKPQPNGKTIFFLETHINDDKKITLTPRQACSVESAGNKSIPSQL